MEHQNLLGGPPATYLPDDPAAAELAAGADPAAVAAAHPACLAAWASLADLALTRGEVVAAFIRPPPGTAIDKEELHTYVREHLAPHKTPRHWFVVDAMPLTGSGKIQKFKLREQWTKGEMKEL